MILYTLFSISAMINVILLLNRRRVIKKIHDIFILNIEDAPDDWIDLALVNPKYKAFRKDLLDERARRRCKKPQMTSYD